MLNNSNERQLETESSSSLTMERLHTVERINSNNEGGDLNLNK